MSVVYAERTFKIYGIWPQAGTLQTRFRNAVPLVWGSLRLAPIMSQKARRENTLSAVAEAEGDTG